MAKQKSVAREPMLYITQPDLQAAKPKMQSTYRSIPKDKTKKSTEVNPSSKNEIEDSHASSQRKDRTPNSERSNKGKDKFGLKAPVNTGTNQFIQPNPWDKIGKEEVEVEQPKAEEQEIEQTEEEETTEEERPKVSFSNRKRRDRFKDMSLQEKVEYFVHLPSSVPRMKCEVYTGETSYRGWIQGFEDGIVKMKILQRPFRVELPFESIESIELKGF